jgi:hypothetical protein
MSCVENYQSAENRQLSYTISFFKEMDYMEYMEV